MTTFERRSRIHAPASRVFAFHEAPDALERLTPPWEPSRVIAKKAGLEVGSWVEMETRVGPVPMRIRAVHTAYEPGRMFRDRMERGPFASWEHTHTVEPDGPDDCWLIDHIEYELPLGPLGALAGGWMVRRRLDRMFDYRHEVTRRACEGGQKHDQLG